MGVQVANRLWVAVGPASGCESARVTGRVPYRTDTLKTERKKPTGYHEKR